MSSCRGKFVTMVAFFLAVLAVGASIALAADSKSQTQVSIPLENGRLNFRDVIREVCEALHVTPPSGVNQIAWSINVQSLLGHAQLKIFERLTDGVIDSKVEPNQLVINVDREQLSTKLRETGHTLEEWIGELTGGMAVHQQRTYGVSFIDGKAGQVGVHDLQVVPKRVVILVHGLDDPGFMWRDLTPRLRTAGYQVALFEYPNDGPISENADLFASSLEELRKAGVERIDVIAHSMGGLVTRDVLTRPAYYASDGSANKAPRYPAIDRFIMLGTPNHGSKWARLRTVSELREYFYRAWHGETGWFSGFDADGSGEAGVDLLPDSDFLRRLNDRPHAQHTKHTIIAGECGSEFADDLKAIAERAQKLAGTSHAPQWLREFLAPAEQEKAISMIGDVVNELGDGCVTVESAKLAGVDDFHVVAGNHLSMVVNIGSDKNSNRVPPAIPLILERLADDR